MATKNVRIKRRTVGGFDTQQPETKVERLVNLDKVEGANLLKIANPTSTSYILVKEPLWASATESEYTNFGSYNMDLTYTNDLDGVINSLSELTIAYSPHIYVDNAVVVKITGPLYYKATQQMVYQTPTEFRDYIGASSTSHQHKISDFNLPESGASYNGLTLVQALNTKADLVNNAIPYTQLPDIIKGSLNFASYTTLAANTDADDFVTSPYLLTSKGDYAIISNDEGTINDIYTTTGTLTAYIKGDTLLYENQRFNAGDWLVLSEYEEGYFWIEIPSATYSTLKSGGATVLYEDDDLFVLQQTTVQPSFDFAITLSPGFDESDIYNYLQTNETQWWADPILPAIIRVDDGSGFTWYIAGPEGIGYFEALFPAGLATGQYEEGIVKTRDTYGAIYRKKYVFDKVDNNYGYATTQRRGWVELTEYSGSTRFGLSNTSTGKEVITEGDLREILKDIAYEEDFVATFTVTSGTELRYSTTNPASDTAASVGARWLNITTGSVYECTAATPPTYTWTQNASIPGFNRSTLDAGTYYTFNNITFIAGSNLTQGTFQYVQPLTDDLILELM